MNNTVEQFDFLAKTDYFGPARVLTFNQAENDVQLLLNGSAEDVDGRQVSASWALPYRYTPHWGDVVLVAGNADAYYVIGLLSGPPSAAKCPHELRLRNGAIARIDELHGEDRLQVYSPKGALIFEYNADNGKSRVIAPDGDLDFAAPKGNINFESSEQIHFKSRRKMLMNCPDLLLDAERAVIHINTTQMTGQKLSGRIDTIRLMANRMETMVNTVIQKAQNIYRTVEELSQLHTGRLRTLVKATFQFKSRKTFMRAEEDFKIQGEKIHLG